MGKPLTINYDVEYNRDKESETSPFMQAFWEGQDAAIDGRHLNTCPYKDEHFKGKWFEGFYTEMLECSQSSEALRNYTYRMKGKKI